MDEVSELHSDNSAGDDCRPLAGAGLASGFMVYLKVRNRNKTFFRIHLIVWANFVCKTVIIINITPSLPIKFWGMGVIL